MSRRLLDRPVAYGIALLLGLLARLPERVAYALPCLVGLLFWALFPARGRLARENVALALGVAPSHPKAVRLARRSTGTLFSVALDFVRMPAMAKRDHFLERVDLGALPELLAGVGPEGIILVTGHLGSWEVAGAILAKLRGELHVIGRRLENPYLDRLVSAGRQAAGIRLHPRRGGIRPLVAALAAGKDCGLLLDQNQRKRPLFLPVFGKLAATDRSAAALSLRFGAPVLVGAALRTGPGFRFRMVVAPLLRPTAIEIRDKDLVGFTRRISSALESLILTAPEQYLWVHQRYRTRPPAEGQGPAVGCSRRRAPLESRNEHPERPTHGR